MPVSYEWDWETVDTGSGDVLDHCHMSKLEGRPPVADEPGIHYCLVLVRDVGNEVDGITDRQWAYATDEWRLPEEFDGGARVPKRFHAEIERWTAENVRSS